MVRPLKPGARRVGLAPILATIMVVSLTLICSVVVGGFVFGVIGTGANTARVQVIGSMIQSYLGIDGSTFFVICASNLGNADGAGFVQLYNSGTAGAAANTLLIIYDGVTITADLGPGCNVLPESTVYILILSLPYEVPQGTQYSGYVSMSNGAEVLLAGSFL
ncbi:MAG TPA: hypothetical protein VLU99_08100 [Nitrososphaerales archaeon]|nr:hypothetical protein [Nitrososphaerales archaeon]HUK75740.1 hypothetical protein [Nitrososphaerales archaeon]